MKTKTYNEAYAELENLVHQLEDDSIQLDTLAEKVVHAKKLIAICEATLRAIEGDVSNNLKNQ
ncbi:hypothetical protein BH09BAC3_BH09BAC3_32580 [soil metagenome]